MDRDDIIAWLHEQVGQTVTVRVISPGCTVDTGRGELAHISATEEAHSEGQAAQRAGWFNVGEHVTLDVRGDCSGELDDGGSGLEIVLTDDVSVFVAFH